MRIGHFQCAVVPGDYPANLATILRGLEQAQAQGLSIVSFPESCYTGYFCDQPRARKYSVRTDGPEIARLLGASAMFSPTVIIGYNEIDGDDIYVTCLVAQSGRLLGTYRKAFPCEPHHTPGREFPVFERDRLKFGVVICADGGYIEPVRILALKGARVIFAPHYNYIASSWVINHFVKVRSDHIARAVENGVYFLRGNSYTVGRDAGIDMDGVGYGDSYLLDPFGEIVVRSQRQTETLISADIDPAAFPRTHDRSLASATALGEQMLEAARVQRSEPAPA